MNSELLRRALAEARRRCPDGDDELIAAWLGAAATKKKGHGIGEPGFVQPDRPMSAIGG